MLKDFVGPQQRLKPQPTLRITNPAFKYTPASGGSAILTAWKQMRMALGEWKGKQ